MKCGKYRVTEDIHVYDCIYGQFKMREGTVFEIMDNGHTGISGKFMFNPIVLRYSEKNYERI